MNRFIIAVALLVTLGSVAVQLADGGVHGSMAIPLRP